MTTNEITKAVATWSAKQWKDVNSRNLNDETRKGYTDQIRIREIYGKKQLKVFWAASKKIERMIAKMKNGELDADALKTEKEIASLYRKITKHGLEDWWPRITNDPERLTKMWRSAQQELTKIERERGITRLEIAERAARRPKHPTHYQIAYEQYKREMKNS